MLFPKIVKQSSYMDAIRCDEPSYLIWKWHPKGTQPGENTRENAIRWGSSLRVKDGEVAVFVYDQKNGIIQDYIEGPYDTILSTENLPVLASIIGLAYDGGTPFQAEIYFINLSKIIQVRFGVPFFDVYDPRFLDFGVPTAVRGTISFQIKDYREFIKLNRLRHFSLDTFQNQIRDAVIRYVKDAIANAPAANNIPLVQIETKTAQFNDIIEYDIKNRMQEDFGIVVSGVDISAIEIDKTSDGYLQLMSVTRDIAATRIQAETQDYVEKLRIQRDESQYAQRKATQTANIGAFQVEKQAEVGAAGANALRHMGENGVTNVELSGCGMGFNPAAMMAGITLGGAIGQNIAGTMNNIMTGPHLNTAAPPPIPSTTYYVAIDGQAAGPFDIATLKQMTSTGRLFTESLVWAPGMSEWVKAETVKELMVLFNNIPPVPPQG